MTAFEVFDKYYPDGSESREYLYIHSIRVMEAALLVAEMNAHMDTDHEVIRSSALLHDIGILMTDAPEIGCRGKYPYIAHGFLGREILEKEGLRKIAPVCERHIGVGISIQDILKNNLPLPHRNMLPVTLEEKIVCYADKFFSKSAADLIHPKPIEKIRRSLLKYGEDKWIRFEEMMTMFGVDYLYNDL